jgi:hypothetical protein
VLDCISGGRLIAGVPLGLGCDANISYGVTPMEQRERWREAVDLMLKAWTAKEFFAWNGKHYQLPKVNLWPRPVQDPHPPLLVPGAASSSTWDYCHDRNLPYAYLSYFGGKSADNVMDRFWERAAAKGKDANPLPRLVSAARRRRRNRPQGGGGIRQACRVFLSQAPAPADLQIAPPGYSDYKSLLNVLKSREKFLQIGDLSIDLKPLQSQGHDREGIRRRRQPGHGARQARGHGQAAQHRPSDGGAAVRIDAARLAKKNIELFGREVLPHLQKSGRTSHGRTTWWPKRLRKAPVRQREMATA